MCKSFFSLVVGVFGNSRVIATFCTDMRTAFFLYKGWSTSYVLYFNLIYSLLIKE